MKKVKILAVVFALMLSFVGMGLSKAKGPTNMGYTDVHCFTLQSVPDDCQVNNPNSQCEITNEGNAWANSGCSDALKRP